MLFFQKRSIWVAFVILGLYYIPLENINHYIAARLSQRLDQDAFRTLKPDNNLIDFCSNDYLGFARSEALKSLFESELANYPHYKLGSTGSRLLAGNADFTEQLETEIAEFHGSETALIFNSGYDANLGVFSCLPQKGDTIITDELIHASIIDGTRLSYANRYVFKHNNLDSLEDKLKASKGNIYIAVESIYSMDGDEAPLAAICALAKQYHAAVIVDEAHATTLFGSQGRGLVDELGLADQIFARIITFSKALGTHGAAVLGSRELRNYLINFARSFIYTTAASFTSHLAVKLAYQYLLEADHQQEIHKRIGYFKSHLSKRINIFPSRSAIQAIIIGGNAEAKRVSSALQMDGFDVRAILSPTVPIGFERLRICLHNHNSFEEINQLTKSLNNLLCV